MADLILGEPTNFTVMSDNGAGAQRITFGPWELDWEFFNAINPIAHFIANVTAAQAFPVIAKGGAENLGYWFDVDTPAGTWASGARCTPQRQAAITQFATFFLATLAMANDDVFLVWYADANNRRTWSERILWVDEGASAWGMLSRQQIRLIPSADDMECVLAGGNLNPVVNALEVINLSLASAGENAVRYAAVGAQQWGPGLIVRRCHIRGGVNGVYIDRCDPGTCVIGNCVFTGCLTGVNIQAGAGEVRVHFNAAIDCDVGFDMTPADTEPRNLIASECRVGFQNVGSLNCLNCVATDASLPFSPTNLIMQDARLNLQFFYDHARPGNKAFAYDFRTHHDSVVRGLGVAVGYAPLAWDMDGVLRPAPPSIGPWEPQSTDYAPGARMVRGCTKTAVHP